MTVQSEFEALEIAHKIKRDFEMLQGDIKVPRLQSGRIVFSDPQAWHYAIYILKKTGKWGFGYFDFSNWEGGISCLCGYNMQILGLTVSKTDILIVPHGEDQSDTIFCFFRMVRKFIDKNAELRLFAGEAK